MSIIVPASGRQPNDVLLVGEAPGETEARRGIPFCGKSGEEQERYLSRYGLSSRAWRKTNVICEYTEGNPDPTPDQLAYWTPRLISEIKLTSPRIILAVGRFAMRWFLGESAELEDCYGIPHRGGEFDPSISYRANGAIVIPIHHPAFGFRSPEAKTLIDKGYRKFADNLSLIQRGKSHLISFRVDEYAGRESYIDVSGEQLADIISSDNPDIIGLDTEGVPISPWSIQISTTPGVSYILRRPSRSRPDNDFDVGIRRLQELVDSNCLIITHDAGTPGGCLYDTIMSREMGLELRHARMFNTMYAAYLLRTEPRGLKALSYRWLGMMMTDYMSLVGDIGRDKQMEYLYQVLSITWSKPETRIVRDNNGEHKPYTPKSIESFATAIVNDVVSGKISKEGKLTDPYARWNGGGSNKGIDRVLRQIVESQLGPMPTATLDDVYLDTAIYYAGRDSDATLRLYEPLSRQLSLEKLSPLMSTGMQVLPMFEEMQHVGMPASRSKFIELRDYVLDKMIEIQSQISTLYMDGKPFNPNSTDQTALLMRKRKLIGEKKTPSGKVSTGKKSIEHLRHEDKAIDAVLTYREHFKIKSTYADPLIEIAESSPVDPSYPDLFIVHGNIKPVTVTSRRLSMEEPSLLNQPVRTELGRRVRACYQTADYETFAAWDFSGQEARVAAHVCDSQLMIKLFTTCRYCGETINQDNLYTPQKVCRKSKTGQHEGGDIHAATAARVFDVKKGDVDDEVYKYKYRMPAKTGFFGILNGMEGPGLLDQFRMYIPPEFDPEAYWSNLDNCTSLVNEIKKKVYPELHTTSERVKKETVRTGSVRDLYGMIRYLPLAWSHDRKEVAEAGRQAFNHIIQGTAQGMIQNAMAWLRPHFREYQESGLNLRPCLQIHDELIVRLDPYLWEPVNDLVMTAFTKHYGGGQLSLKVPIEADGHMANSWSELK